MNATIRSIWLAVALAFAALTIAPATASADTASLRQAYKKEFAYLEAQKKALQGRLDKLEARSKTEVAQAQAEVDRLQGRLLSLTLEADRLEEKLYTLERTADSQATGADVVATTLEQANTTLDKHGVQIAVPPSGEATSPDDGAPADEAAAYAAAITELFDASARLIDEQSSIRKTDGGFFLPGGEKTSGTIVRYGNVAAYGISAEAAGALAPAGQGRLKLMTPPSGKADAAQTARALAHSLASGGEQPETLAAFLFESMDKAIEEQKAKTWLEVVDSGGVIAWVIVGLGLLGLLLVVARALILAVAGANTGRLLEKTGELVRAGKVDEARVLCREARGSAARVLGQTLEHLEHERDTLEDVVSEALLHEMPTLERFGSTILVFAAVAPLLGLLGTVTGMISTFDIITEFGTGDPKLLSGGISEALVTTQLGLIVAIPLLLIGNLEKGWANGILTRLERGALRLMNLGSMNLANSDEAETPAATPEAREARVKREATDYLGAV